MKKNVGSMERYVRLGAGVAATAALPFVKSRWARALLGMVATTGFSTGLSRYCPVNQALGVDHFSADPSDFSKKDRLASLRKSVNNDTTFSNSSSLH